MAPNVPAFLSLSLILLVLVLLWLIGRGVSKTAGLLHYPSAQTTRLTRLILVCLNVWLSLMAWLAWRGFFLDFQTVPPRIALGVVPMVLAIIALALVPASRDFICAASPAWLIDYQVFRVPLELILWQLFVHQIIPQQMTFEGRNWDILPALLAPLVSWLCCKRKLVPVNVAILWNLFGLAMVLNIVTVAALSTPSLMRVFMNEPANTVVAYFPFVWIPTFLVPLALFGHVMSLMQLLRQRK